MREKNMGKPASHYRTIETSTCNQDNQTLDKWLATITRDQDTATTKKGQETDRETDNSERENCTTLDKSEQEDNGGGGNIGLVRGLYNNTTPLDRINFNLDSYDNEAFPSQDRISSKDSHGDIDRTGTKRRQGVG
jgi:hypothetical protein